MKKIFIFQLPKGKIVSVKAKTLTQARKGLKTSANLTIRS